MLSGSVVTRTWRTDGLYVYRVDVS